MHGYQDDIEKRTRENNNFRKVLYTSEKSQLVVMSLLPGEDIGMEVHKENDQFFRFEQGQGKCIIDKDEYSVKKDMAVIVPAGATHNIINTSSRGKLKFYTIYSPPHHKDGLIHRTKKEAEKREEEFDGETSE